MSFDQGLMLVDREGFRRAGRGDMAQPPPLSGAAVYGGEVDGGTDDKRMRLRYAGTCRVCGSELPAKSEAIYERSTRTVRCVNHEVSTPAAPPAAEELDPAAPEMVDPERQERQRGASSNGARLPEMNAFGPSTPNSGA